MIDYGTVNKATACEARLRKPCVQLLLGAPANHSRYSPNEVRGGGEAWRAMTSYIEPRPVMCQKKERKQSGTLVDRRSSIWISTTRMRRTH